MQTTSRFCRRSIPEPTFFANTGTIAGTIYAPNGTTRLTGVNVIARNLADPFEDAVSAISSDFTDSTSQADPIGWHLHHQRSDARRGLCGLRGRDPGGWIQHPACCPAARTGGVLQRRQTSRAIRRPTTRASTTAVTAVAGSPVTGIDVIFNPPAPGDPLAVGTTEMSSFPCRSHSRFAVRPLTRSSSTPTAT